MYDPCREHAIGSKRTVGVREQPFSCSPGQITEGFDTDDHVDALVAERVWQELVNALTEPRPELFIETLRECGALARIFPEIDALFGVPQRQDYHPEIDAGVHTLMALAEALWCGARNGRRESRPLPAGRSPATE